MTWRLDSAVADILKKGGGFTGLDRDEALQLLRLPLHSKETYWRIWAKSVHCLN